jgi:2-polyprenyl-3-methyl-5-hydroxy-6-metoxy-1,4-benzoquinol methylase
MDSRVADGNLQDYFEEGATGWLDTLHPLLRWQLAREQTRRIKRIASVKWQGRFLEVGFGSGDLLIQAKQVGFEVLGVDASKHFCERLRGKYQIPVFQGMVEELPAELRQEGFDVVVLCHVLEHVDSPVGLLRTLRTLLKPDGVLYVEVPNYDTLSAHLPGWHAYYPFHLSYFGQRSFNIALEKAELQVVGAGTHTSMEYWPYTIIRTLLPFYNRRILTSNAKKAAPVGPRRWAQGIPESIRQLYALTVFGMGLLFWLPSKLEDAMQRGGALWVVAKRAH